MSCGIICRQDAYNLYAELAHIQRLVDHLPGPPYAPKPNPFERWLWLGLGVAGIIFGVAMLGLLTYGIVTDVIPAIF